MPGIPVAEPWEGTGGQDFQPRIANAQLFPDIHHVPRCPATPRCRVRGILDGDQRPQVWVEDGDKCAL